MIVVDALTVSDGGFVCRLFEQGQVLKTHSPFSPVVGMTLTGFICVLSANRCGMVRIHHCYFFLCAMCGQHRLQRRSFINVPRTKKSKGNLFVGLTLQHRVSRPTLAGDATDALLHSVSAVEDSTKVVLASLRFHAVNKCQPIDLFFFPFYKRFVL